MRQSKLELLAPAGSYAGMRSAFLAGADAVYVGGKRFGARAYAQNFDDNELLRAIDETHLRGRKLYLAVNTLVKEWELKKELYSYLKPLYEHGLDAVIVQDFGLLSFVRREFPDLPVHASTQMTVTGPEGAKLLKDEGVVRVVTARELSLSEIRAIYDRTGMEIECFVHGALCYCYSGQCLLSSMIGGRSGNRGRCAQPCRLPYRAAGGASDGRGGPYLLSPKDICTLELLPELLTSGVCSLKIEGRMKRPEYAAGVTAVYRKYVDLYLERGAAGYRVEQEDMETLKRLYSRGDFSGGYLKQHNGRSMITLKKPDYNEKDQKLLDHIKKDLERERADHLPPAGTDAGGILRAFRRDAPEHTEKSTAPAGLHQSARPRIRVYAESEEYIYALKDIPAIDAFYIDSHAAGLPKDAEKLQKLSHTVRAAGKKCYLALPRIFRRDTARAYGKVRERVFSSGIDGVLIRNLEELAFLKGTGYAGEIVADSSLYTMNRGAAGFLTEKGVCRTTAPFELNARELKERGMADTELVVYGCVPVMVSAQCVKKTLGKCDKKDGRVTLKDRKNKKFIIKNYCEECYNVIYNTCPLSLLGLEREVLALRPEGLRIDLTVESRKEAASAARAFADAFYGKKTAAGPSGDFTRGHFKRGIE